MRAQRWALGISFVLLIVSAGGLLALSHVYMNENAQACLLGLLTGTASGSLLAAMTSACSLRVAATHGKRRLEYLCATLISNLYGANLIFSKVETGALPAQIIAYAFICLNTGGIACANAICAEIDRDLFIVKKKRRQLAELLSVAGKMGPRAAYLSNRAASVLRLEKEFQKLGFSEKTPASDALESLGGSIGKLLQEICEEGKSLSLEYENIANTAAVVVLASRRLSDFEERIKEGKAEQDSVVESAVRDNTFRS